MRILVANIGSTTFKYRLLEMPSGAVFAQGKFERIGQTGSQFPTYDSAIGSAVADIVGEGKPLRDLSELSAIAFKAVHAGEVTGAQLVTEGVLKAMEEFTFYAPAHNIPYLAAMRAFSKALPVTPLVAVFETGFFQSLNEATTTYAVPYEWRTRYGIRRYGFHGASHRAASERVQALTRASRHISCHLGGSSSLAAIRDGVAIDTSFGISPQSGLPQNNRVGDIDAFAVLEMMRILNVGPEEMSEILSSQSGLAGLSGGSGDVRELLEGAAMGDARSKLALDVYARSARNYIGAFYLALGGLDVLSFTGGIGENSAELRRAICEGLEVIGVQLDPAANITAKGEAWIEMPGSAVRILIMPADEEGVVARLAAQCLDSTKCPEPADSQSRAVEAN